MISHEQTKTDFASASIKQAGVTHKRLITFLLASALYLISCCLTCAHSAEGDDEHYKRMRDEFVIHQLKAKGIKDEGVLQAMRDIPRQLFVPDKYKTSAYGDFPLPIGYGQTIPQPYIGALMTELLEAKAGQIALEVGTGSGYQAAVLSRIVNTVYTIEIIPPLGEAVGKRFELLGYKNVLVRIGDGYNGWPEYAPFDRIIVTAVSTHIPPPLVKQLVAGGKMVIPIGNPFRVQNLMLVEKSKQGEIKTRSVLPVKFAPLIRKWK
jgi:protein-L-isoaspartate(D-aspartate) O-methyltransferase